MTKPATNAHLYPFTLAFDAGLKDGSITLDVAREFCDRVFDAYQEAAVAQHDTMYKFVTKGLKPLVTPESNE